MYLRNVNKNGGLFKWINKVDSMFYERNNLESGDIIWIINILVFVVND